MQTAFSTDCPRPPTPCHPAPTGACVWGRPALPALAPAWSGGSDVHVMALPEQVADFLRSEGVSSRFHVV
jgi:hypothetical protein